MKNIEYNPIFKDYKFPVGANKNSDEIFITINIIKEYNLYNLKLIIKDDNNKIYEKYDLKCISQDNGYNKYQTSFLISQAGIYWYYFEFSDIYGKHFIGSSNNLEAVMSDYYPISWQLSIHEEFKGNLDWFKGKIMYQIMVDRFFNDNNKNIRKDVIFHTKWDEQPLYKPIQGEVLNNDFFGGNLRGIIKKLSYLKSLGVDIIYLNPIFEAYSNHKYDTGDYMKIDSMFGTEDDFQELCQKSEEMGMSIILDGVFNHTGSDSIYFNKNNNYPEIGAYQSQDSKYYNWYKFIKFPDEYESWWGVKTLPAVNQENKELLDFITGEEGVLNKWLHLGARGFRLDVVDELNDNFVNLITHRIKLNNSNNIVIGEVWEDASNKIAYGKRRSYFNGHQLDSVMNYPLKNAIFEFLNHNNPLSLKHQMRHLLNNYPKHVLDCLMNPLGTHDTIRLLNNFAYTPCDQLSKEAQAEYRMTVPEYQNAVEKLKMATALQFTLPGVPSIYYGDETGMQGFKDPFCRHPMNWDNVDQNIINWYKILSDIRLYDVFKDGLYQEEFIENNIFSFSRVNDSYKIITIINNSTSNYSLKIGTGFDLIGKCEVKGKFTVPKKSVGIVKIDHK